MQGIKHILYLLVLLSATVAEESCSISDEEISKIGEILTHIDKPIYKEEQDDVSDSDECAQLLKSIHMQLRRLTQKYKLMNKGYVKIEEFQKMAEEYDRQLLELNKELDQFKKQSQGSANNRMDELKKNIKTLEQDVNKLHEDLKGVAAEYDDVQKALCITYLESNQINKARDKVKHVSSKYLMELIQHFLKSTNGSVLPVIDFSSAIPDLDDRGEAYKRIFNFMQSNGRLETDDSLLLEAEILKINSSFEMGSKITDERKNELQVVLQKLSPFSDKALNKWTVDLNQSRNLVIIKNSIDHLYLTQMQILGEKIGNRNDFDSVKNLLKLLTMSNNRHKIAAYKSLIEKNVGYALGMIWFDTESMDFDKMSNDPHVSSLFNETYNLLPESLKKLRSCMNNVHIYHIQDKEPDKCIVATQNSAEVKHPLHKHILLGHYKQVITNSSGCTRFRLEPANDKSSVRIVSEEGNALTNINSDSGSIWFNRVGAPYTNSKNAKLDWSQDWILEANRGTEMIKIRSEFNAYQTGKSLDYLLINKYTDIPYVVTGKYGVASLKNTGSEQLVGWRLMCAV